MSSGQCRGSLPVVPLTLGSGVLVRSKGSDNSESQPLQVEFAATECCSPGIDRPAHIRVVGFAREQVQGR